MTSRIGAATEEPGRGGMDRSLDQAGPPGGNGVDGSDRASQTLQASRAPSDTRRRGWLVRRLLLLADVIGLTLAFLLTEIVWGVGAGFTNRLDTRAELLLFLVALVGWVGVARLYGLYDRDEEQTDPSTVDDIVGVFHIVTVGAWLLFIAASVVSAPFPDGPKALTFWFVAIAFVTLGRIAGRAAARRSAAYLQNALIVGAGDVGQLVARKLRHHHEYGINVLGFVDAQPKQLRGDLDDVPVLGPPERLVELVGRLAVDRVIVAFSNESHDAMLADVRTLRQLGVQIDIVPRLFEVVGPRVAVNTVEGMQLLGLAPVRPGRGALMLKRSFDVVLASGLLVASAPFFAYVAWRIKRDSPGPVLFCQTRLGMGLKEFTSLKLRTMYAGTTDEAHRAYIETTMDPSALPEPGGLYKLERPQQVTKTGQWLRRTSLDELPQLWNVLRGDMSLVGPRPCLPYETAHFAPHHFERFSMPAGLTGLWQVKARAHATFGEALDMDVAYVRGWSFGLDLRILCLTPLQIFRPKATR
jgi:exopolysaccharide biosynthesis polyprenyl glycosylphosphotransferase